MGPGIRKGWARELGDHVSSQEAKDLSKLQGEFLILMLLCAFTWHTVALH